MTDTDLIERLEKATEGDHHLDLKLRVWNLANGGKESRGIRRYTTSLDAALKLVPESHWWRLQNDGGATVGLGVGPIWFTHENAATTCLALCIASLRARQSETPDLQGGE